MNIGLKYESITISLGLEAGWVFGFPKPADMTGRSDAYAGFVYVQLDGEQPRFTVARNVISEELEAVTSSSGDKFEEKLRKLKTNS